MEYQHIQKKNNIQRLTNIIFDCQGLELWAVWRIQCERYYQPKFISYREHWHVEAGGGGVPLEADDNTLVHDIMPQHDGTRAQRIFDRVET